MFSISGKKIMLLSLMLLVVVIPCGGIFWFFVGDMPHTYAFSEMSWEFEDARDQFQYHPTVFSLQNYLWSLLRARDFQLRIFMIHGYEDVVITPLINHQEFKTAISHCKLLSAFADPYETENPV